MSRSSVVLPEPEGPRIARNSPDGTLERDAVEHRRGGAIGLGDPVERDGRWRRVQDCILLIRQHNARRASPRKPSVHAAARQSQSFPRVNLK